MELVTCRILNEPFRLPILEREKLYTGRSIPDNALLLPPGILKKGIQNGIFDEIRAFNDRSNGSPPPDAVTQRVIANLSENFSFEKSLNCKDFSIMQYPRKISTALQELLRNYNPEFRKYGLLRLENSHHLWLYSLLPPHRRSDYAIVGRRCV